MSLSSTVGLTLFSKSLKMIDYWDNILVCFLTLVDSLFLPCFRSLNSLNSPVSSSFTSMLLWWFPIFLSFLELCHFLLLTSIFHTILIKIFFMTVSTECSWIKEPWIVFTKLDWFLINCLIYSSKKTRPNVGILILSNDILITHFSRRLALNLLMKCVSIIFYSSK